MRVVLVEAPLWLVWRIAYGLGVVREAVSDTAAHYLDFYRDATPAQRRLALITTALAVALLALAAFTFSLL
ncbi:hypothetical protein AB5J62_33780 [Amycolatopsis sp. cg5]|uniref:hypothetical protein n=1 Tax=Amycolatopsis sp. cg5 TaxID=3238802 RepID=UPI0035241D0D